MMQERVQTTAISLFLGFSFMLFTIGWNGTAPASQDKTEKKAKLNMLKDERSPYLRSAAHQPVNWFPWGDEAFDRAKSENKPILLDIGAVWCHWCHVMDRESYENEEIAAIINEHYIPVKVDRDERPDVDVRYQAAVSAISGQGGWPLTAFLTPEGRVFYGGTYFPPDDRLGRPGLKRVLLSLSETYKNDPKKIFESAEQLYNHLRDFGERRGDDAELSEALVDSALSSISKSFDVRYGGFGNAPKFPHASAIEFLLWRHSLTGESWMLSIVDSTLKKMARGGIHDQLGGGFHRYSTDERWVVPHFEKMLYDNAELLKNYVHAYQATEDQYFKEVAEGIIRYTNEVLSDQQRGGFYSSQDADIGMYDDGDYFTWTAEEARQVLSPSEFEVLSQHFHLDGAGEVHGSDRHVPFVSADAVEIAGNLKRSVSEIQELIRSGKEKLLNSRFQRKTPYVDQSVYSNWNGMMISSYIEAYKGFGEKAYLDFAIKTLERILAEAVGSNSEVAHTVSGPSTDGYLDDQVRVIGALLDAYEVTAADKFIYAAERIMKRTLEQYWDTERSGFFDLARERGSEGPLGLPQKPIQDAPSSGANAVAIFVLSRLYQITENEEYQGYAEQSLRYFSTICKDYGIFAATYFHALDTFFNPPPHVVVVGDKADPQTQQLLKVAIHTYRPNKVVGFFDSKQSSLTRIPSIVRSMLSTADQPTAYVCTKNVCAPPARNEEVLVKTIRTFGVDNAGRW